MVSGPDNREVSGSMKFINTACIPMMGWFIPNRLMQSQFMLSDGNNPLSFEEMLPKDDRPYNEELVKARIYNMPLMMRNEISYFINDMPIDMPEKDRPQLLVCWHLSQKCEFSIQIADTFQYFNTVEKKDLSVINPGVSAAFLAREYGSKIDLADKWYSFQSPRLPLIFQRKRNVAPNFSLGIITDNIMIDLLTMEDYFRPLPPIESPYSEEG